MKKQGAKSGLIPHPHVEMTPKGAAIRGTDILVRRLWMQHRVQYHNRILIGRVLARYPNLNPASVLSALAFAYDNLDLIEAELRSETFEASEEP